MVEELGISATRCYQLLSVLIDKPAALNVDPVTVHRVQRLRDQRRACRTARPTEQ